MARLGLIVMLNAADSTAGLRARKTTKTTR
jgi:hypothetical protein